MKTSRFSRGLILICLIISLIFLIETSASADQGTPNIDGQKPYPYRPGEFTVTYDGGVPEVTPVTRAPVDDPDFLDFERIVYASWRTGDWEVFSQQGYEVGATNLTSSPASSDSLPRLNNSHNRIAFTSNRTGTSQIYTMNLDGSSVVQVTNNATNSTDAEWFPDDLKLIYVCNGDLWVINIDGTGNVQMTSSGLREHDPTVSPDGSKIAWVISSGNYGKIWVMNSDKSNMHTITPTNLKYVQNTTWAPDGLHIGFDYDQDADEWNELVQIHYDGNGMEVLYNTGGDLLDLWMGGYTYNQEAVIFSFVYYNNDFSINRSFTYALKQSPYVSLYSLADSDYDLFPDSKSMDLQPPNTRVNTLPEFTRAGNLNLAWSGSDVGIAGIHGYYLELKRNPAAAWYNWFNDMEDIIHTHGTSTTVNGIAGDQMYFQVSGIDNAENREAFPGGDGDASTKIFSYYLQGIINDNRGIPLPATQLTLTPAAWNATETDASGSYFYRLANIGTHSLSASNPLFGQWSSLTRNITSDTILPEVYLPPLDNLIANGDFETSLDPWTAVGNMQPTLSGTNYLTGTTGLRMTNRGDTSTGIRFSTGGTDPIIQDLKRGPDGSLHAIWRDIAPSPFKILLMYAYKPVSGAWSTPVQLAASDNGSGNQFDLAVDNSGIAHVVWEEIRTSSSDIWYASRSNDGSWSTPVSPSGVFAYSDASPRITVDDDRGLYLVWNESGSVMRFSYKPEGGAWTTKETIPGMGSGVPARPIVVDSTDTLHIISHSTDGMIYLNRTSDGTWSSPQNLTSSTYRYVKADLSIDQADHLHLGWIYNNQVYYMERDGSGTWSEATIIRSITNPSLANISIASADNGRVVLCWQGYSPGNIYFRIRSAGGSWSPEQLLIENITNRGVDVSIDEDDILSFIVSKGYRDVYYHTLYQPRLVESSISQAITIPADMHEPTLAYMLHTDINPGAGSLQLLIDNVVIATYSVSDPTLDFHWLDLSDYAGTSAELEIIFQADHEVGFATAWLDDVSLGSYQMPRIDQVDPAMMLSGWQGQVFTISGDNFIDPVTVMLDGILLTGVTYVDETSLLIELPADFPPGIYDLRVYNPMGYKAVLTNALSLGLHTFLSTINRP